MNGKGDRSWVRAVKKYVDTVPDPPKKAEDPVVEAIDWMKERPPAAAGCIPTLCPKPNPWQELVDLCKIEERNLSIKSISRTLLQASEVWSAFAKASAKANGSDSDDALRMKSYVSYRNLARHVIPLSTPYHCNPYLTPHMYLLSDRDPDGSSPTLPLFTNLSRKTLLYEAKLLLEECDSIGDGYLVDSDLEAFIRRLMPNLRTVRNLHTIMGGHYEVFYKCHSARKFFFFLDGNKRGRISIDAIMESDILLELLKLYNPDPDYDEEEEEEVTEDIADNWFAFHIMYRVYQHYVELDTDWNGMLSITEMYEYNNTSFSRLFIDRFFETFPTYGYKGEIDYKRYLDFVLATEHTQTTAAINFFWKILDIGGCGFLAKPHVRLYAQELSERLTSSGLMNVETEDVVQEIFDMVNPADPTRITKADIERCGQSNTVLSILVDHRAFHNYDSRESQLAASSQQARQEGLPRMERIVASLNGSTDVPEGNESGNGVSLSNIDDPTTSSILTAETSENGSSLEELKAAVK
eukprot:Sspe_Gene.53658::Locus_29637_Transcript_1_1_Confidence_1.000_Length_1697::g.53658::m.53658/K11583/PPP2R3; serine/threonine-protein phosphatase 2A regulatory subunit B''